MPKTRDAFALRELSMEMRGAGYAEYEYECNFDKLFSEILDLKFTPSPTSNTVFAICKFAKCKLKKNPRLDADKLENARIMLRCVEASYKRLDRHIQRLQKFSARYQLYTRRAEGLIDSYDFIEGVLEKFLSSLTVYYSALNKKFSKTFARQVGRRIRISRQLKSLSQESVAKELGVAAITVSTWERGEREPSLYSILQLSRVLDVSLDFLFGNSEKSIK